MKKSTKVVLNLILAGIVSVISYIGFKTDTLIIKQPHTIKHQLTPTNNLNEVVIKNRKKTTSVSYSWPILSSTSFC